MSRPRKPSVLCPPRPQRDTFPKKPAQVGRPGALRLWKVPQVPLSQSQSTQVRRKGLSDSASLGPKPAPAVHLISADKVFFRVAATSAGTSLG